MRKTVEVTALFAATALLFISCEKKAEAVHQYSEKVHLVMAELNPEDSITGQMDNAFKQKLEELSNGNMTVEVRYYGVMGNEERVMQCLMSEDNNSIQLARVSANLSDYGAKKSLLLSIPYTFSDDLHFWRFASSEYSEEILREPYEAGFGFKGLCFAEEGFRNFFSTEPVNSISDLDGLQMRVSGDTLESISKALKSYPVIVPYTDLYMALQTGRVVVAEQPLSNYLSNSFYTVAPYMIMDGHMIGAVQIVISSKCWDSLSYYQQVMVKKAADYASDYCKSITREKETNDAIDLLTRGVTLVEVKDKSPWQYACRDIIDENSKDYPELYSKILSLAY